MKNYNEVSFNRAFEWAVEDNFEDEIALLPSEKELSLRYKFSAEFSAKMQKLIAAERRYEISRSVKKTLQTPAIVLIILAVGFVGVVTISPKLNAAVHRVIMEWYEQFASFSADRNNTNVPSKLEPTYLPEGFVEVNREFLAERVDILYQNENGKKIYFSSMSSSWEISVNNENIEYSEVTIDGIKYHIFDSLILDDIDSAVVWEHNGYLYHIFAPMKEDILLNIAKNVK